MKLGGYAKMSIVQSFDPVGSTDRFAPGTIPVPEDPNGLENQANLNARQSRLNVDMRRDSTIGPLRAFIEGSRGGGAVGATRCRVERRDRTPVRH